MKEIELNEQQVEWLLTELRAILELPTMSDYTSVIVNQIISKLEDEDNG